MAISGKTLLALGAGAVALWKLSAKKAVALPVTTTSTPISDRPTSPVTVTLNAITDLIGIMFSTPSDPSKVIQITKVDSSANMAYGQVVRGPNIGEGFGAGANDTLILLQNGIYTQVT